MIWQIYIVATKSWAVADFAKVLRWLYGGGRVRCVELPVKK